MCHLSSDNQGGYALLEILISMAIGLVVIVSLSSAFTMQRNAYDMNGQAMEALQVTRAALDMMVREISMAGYNPTGAAFPGIEYDTSQLHIRSDMDGDGTIAGPNEDITYKYSSGANQIMRRTGDDVFYSMASNINTFSFAYMDGRGNATTVTIDIRQVQIRISAKTAKPTADHVPKTLTMTSSAIAPNLAYPRGIGFGT